MFSYSEWRLVTRVLGLPRLKGTQAVPIKIIGVVDWG
jgi:hypothetical protein